MSFLTSFSVVLVDFKQRHTNYPAYASVLFTLFTCIDLMVTALKFLSLSGPIKQFLFNPQAPLLIMPETTNPTPSTKNVSLH